MRGRARSRIIRSSITQTEKSREQLDEELDRYMGKQPEIEILNEELDQYRNHTDVNNLGTNSLQDFSTNESLLAAGQPLLPGHSSQDYNTNESLLAAGQPPLPPGHPQQTRPTLNGQPDSV